MSERTPLTRLKRQLLNRRNLTLLPHTRKPVRAPEPLDEYPKSPKMKYLELKYQCSLKIVLFTKSLSDAEQFFRHEVDRTTLSRWRGRIHKYLGLVTVGK